MGTFTRATSTLPGATGYEYYGDSDWEHFYLWRGLARTLLVYCKPGHLFNTGGRVMSPTTSSYPWVTAFVNTAYDTLGWSVIGLEFNPPFSNDSPKREPSCSRPWPGPILSLAKAMRYINTHRDDSRLWGYGRSINRVVFVGTSSGHTAGMLLSFMPEAALSGMALATSQGLVDLSARCAPDAVVGACGQTDWTQFAYDPTDSTNIGPFSFDTHQYFEQRGSGRGWSSEPTHVKRMASPMFWLGRSGRQIPPQFGQWGVRPGSGVGKNFTPNAWSSDHMQLGLAYAVTIPSSGTASDVEFSSAHLARGRKLGEASQVKFELYAGGTWAGGDAITWAVTGSLRGSPQSDIVTMTNPAVTATSTKIFDEVYGITHAKAGGAPAGQYLCHAFNVFTDPHHYVQGAMLERALGGPQAGHRIVWGGSNDNPQGWNNDDYPDDTDIAALAHTFLEERGIG